MRARLALSVLALAALLFAARAARDVNANERRLQAAAKKKRPPPKRPNAAAVSGQLYTVQWSKVTNVAAYDIAVDSSPSRSGDVWALVGPKQMTTTCTGQSAPSGTSCGWQLMKLMPNRRFRPQPHIRGCGKRLTIMPDTGKPWLLDMCSNILGWLGTNVVMSSPQSLADSYTFRDITAVNSTVMMLDGNVSWVPNPPFYIVDTQYNTAARFSIAGMSYAISSTWATSGQTLVEETMQLGSELGGMGPWYLPIGTNGVTQQVDLLGQAMANWPKAKAPGGTRSNYVFLDAAVDANDVLWVTGGVLGSKNTDSSVAVWYWDNNATQFVRVWEMANMVPGRLAFGKKGTVYVTTGVWNYRGADVTSGCNLDSTEGLTVHAAMGPLGKCFTPTALWKGVVRQNAMAVKAAGAGRAPAESVPFVPGKYIGQPVDNFMNIGPQ